MACSEGEWALGREHGQTASLNWLRYMSAQGLASSVTQAEINGRALSCRGRPQAIFWGETTQILNGCCWRLLLKLSFSNPKGLFPSSEHS